MQADVLRWEPERRWDLWHDRAMLHFLTDPDDRARYGATMRRAIGAGGGFVIGSFAEDGPTQCSGLPVHRSTAADLRSVVGDAEILVERRSTHITLPAPSSRLMVLRDAGEGVGDRTGDARAGPLCVSRPPTVRAAPPASLRGLPAVSCPSGRPSWHPSRERASVVCPIVTSIVTPHP